MLAIDQAAIRAELDKILASQAFVNSPRMSRFLRFVVETVLAGKAATIKEYVIAIEVFGKPEDYDPQADSTVRTEASKLRSRLERYYSTEGRDDVVLISIPKGTYVPVFEERPAAGPSGLAPAPNAGALPPETSAPNRGEEQAGTSSPPRTSRAFPALKVAAGLITAIMVAGVFVLWWSRPPASPPPRLVPLTTYPELEEQPSLSPDGSQVAFRWKGDIYVRQTGAEAYVRITRDPAVESWPAWSPDGSHIAFVRNGEVFLVSPLGGAERKVAESAGRVAWMPDGGSLLVLQNTSQYGKSIFRVSLGTREKQRLTFPQEPSPGDNDMAPSPDGKWIGFCRTLTDEGCDLHVIPAGGGEPRRLTNYRRALQGFAWTSDSQEIVFASNRQGWFRLFRIPGRSSGRDGVYANPQLVEAAGDDARFPSISRGRLVYQRYSRNFDIYRVEVAGREGTASHHIVTPEPLITSTRLDVTPVWSPDGTRIAFTSDRSGFREIWVCDADGSNPLQLTFLDGATPIVPRWSPNGKLLTFSVTSGPDGNFAGYVVDANGGSPRQLQPPGHRTMALPVYSRDGRSIYFIPGPVDGPVEAWKMPAGGGEAVQVTKGRAFHPEESPDGDLLYYTKGFGRQRIWSTPVSGGPERQVLDGVADQNWTVGAHGIYYLEAPTDQRAPTKVCFHSFKTERSTVIGTVDRSAVVDFAGISLSPDGRWLLYSQVTATSSDLMMIENFR